MRTFIVLFLGITTATVALRDEDPAQRVNQLFATFAKPGSPGCSIVLVRNGNFVYKKSFGYASLELGVPLTPESVFYLGSVSKQFAAASMVLAAEPGYHSIWRSVLFPATMPRRSHRRTTFSSSSCARRA